MKTTIHPEDILNSLGEALITADTTGVITWLNPLAENLVGVRAEDLRGKHLESILKTINLPDVKSYDHLAEMILQKGKVCFHGKEVQLISRDKSDIQVSGSAVPVINSQGVTTGVVISFQDTTLTNYAGENLLASEARFSKLFNSNPAPLGITRSSDFRIVAVNDVWCRLTGYSREEVLGRTSTELGIARPQTIKQVRDRLEVSDSLKEFEISLYTRNGEEKLVLITSEPVEFNGETFILNTLLDVTERKQAEHKIRESEQRFRSLYENATIGMYRTTPNGQILLANPALVHMLGYSSFDELKARSLEAEGYEPSYERSKFKEQIERNHEVHGFESAWTRRDGTAVFVRESAKAIRDEEGHILYYEGTVEDITERKLTEEALQENERKLSTLLGNLSGFAYRRMNDRNWTIEFISGGCEAITGYKPGDFLGNSVITFNDIINPADREMVWEKIQDSILSKESYELEYRIITRDKTEKWIWEHGRSVYSNDRFEALEGYITDITGRKLAEEKVRNTENWYRSIIENAPDGFVIIDIEGRYKYASPSVARIFGYVQEDIPYLNSAEMTHPEDLPAVLAEITKLLHDPTYIPTIQYRFLHKNGSWRWIESTINNLLSVPGVAGIIINFRDIHERKLADAELKRNQELLKEAQKVGHIGHMEWKGKDQPLICSDELYRLLELEPQSVALTQYKIAEFLTPEEAQRLKSLDHQFFANQTDIDYEFFIKLPSGKLRWLHQHGSVQYSDEGKPLHMISTVQDITDRKLAEAALMRSEHILRLFVEHSPAAIAMFDTEMRYIAVSHRYISDYRLTETNLEGLSHYDIFPEMGQERKAIHQRCLLGEVVKCDEDPLKRIDGTVDWVRYELRPWYEADNSIGGLIFFSELITERKKAEITLRESEKKYRDLINSMNDAIFVIDYDTTILDVNDSAATMLGYSRAELISMKISEIDVKIKPEAIQQLADKMPEEKIQIFETEHRAKDKTVIPVEVSSNLVSYAGRTVILSIARDITERKKAQMALLESEEKFRKAFMTSPDSININRLHDGLYITINQGFMQMTGYNEEEVIGKTSFELDIWSDPDDRKHLTEMLRQNGYVENMEAQFRMKNGDIRYGLMSASVIMLNNVPHILNITRDITDRKQAQVALFNSEEKYRTVTESFESVIITVDKEGKIYYVNQRAANAFNLTPLQIQDKNLNDIFPPLEAESHISAIKHVIAKRQGITNESLSMIKGMARWYRTSIQPILNASGDVNLALVNAVDITEQKEAESEIKRQNDDLQLINALNEAANRGNSISEISRVFARQAISSFNSYNTALFLLSDDNRFLELQDTSIPGKVKVKLEKLLRRPLPPVRIPVNEKSYYYQLLRNNQGVLIISPEEIRKWITAFSETTTLPSAFKPTLRKLLPAILKLVDVRSAIIIPLEYNGKVIGTLEMYSRGQLQESDLLRLQKLSAQVTAAIVRKQAEDKLVKSLEREQFLGDLVRNASVAMGVGYPDGHLGMCNLAFQQLTGYSEDELKSISWNAILTPPEWQDIENRYLAEIQKSRKPAIYEKEYIHKSGKRIPVELVVHPFIGSGGDVTHYYAFVTDITERKKAVEELRKSEQKYRLLFEKVKNGYTLNEIITDENGVPVDFMILEGNTEVEEVFGMKKAELINKKGTEIRTSFGAEWAKRLKICADAALLGSEGSFEIIRFNTGRHYNVHVYSPARNYFAAIFEDVTEKKNIEGALKQVEEKYFALFNSKTDITLLTEISDRGVPGRIIEANDQAVEITGYPREELLRLTPSDVSIYPLSGSEEVAKQFLVGNTARIEHTIKCRVGRDFPAEIVLYKIMSGDRAYAIIAVHDITEVKRAEKEAEESRRLVNALMNNVPLGVTIVDTDINVIWRSQTGETILGISEKESIRKSALMIPMYHPQTKTLIPYDEIPVVKAVRNDTLVENVEILIFNARGAPVHLSCNAVSVKNQSGEIIGGIMTYQDITTIKNREEEISGLNELLVKRTEELEASNKELEAFSYSVSHDLRAPLRHISGFSRLLSDRLGDKLDNEGANYLHRVNDAANLMSTLINDILKLSRVTRSELTITKVNLSDVVKTVSYDKRLAFPDRKINILIRDNLYADCDVSLMRICLNNLFENAWKFTMKNENPVIEFGKVTKKGKSCFFIRDNGVGFDMKYSDKLFGAFQRLHSTSEFEGTGIGLAIVQRVIGKHGGDIWAESEINKGTTFYFTLTGLSNGEEKINTAG